MEVQNMGTYKNDYTRSEDQTLWELHEIRNGMHKEFKNKSVEEINSELMNIYDSWKTEHRASSKQTA
jgi:hypothetical protein